MKISIQSDDAKQLEKRLKLIPEVRKERSNTKMMLLKKKTKRRLN